MEHNISGRTQLYCLIGSPIGHSGSPAIYNYSFDRAGIDAVYLAFDVPLDKLEEGIAAIKAFHVKGFNVTMPDKTAVMKYLDEITPAAERIGACNTVKVTDEGKLIGYNTDGIGFTRQSPRSWRKTSGKKGSSAWYGRCSYCHLCPGSHGGHFKDRHFQSDGRIL